MTETDWSTYYADDLPEITYVSRFTNDNVLKFINKYNNINNPVICELGGGGSRSFKPLMANIDISRYYVVDNNKHGLDLFAKRYKNDKSIILNKNILDLDRSDFDTMPDIVFSLGLIEHFSKKGTKKAIEAHLNICKKGGLIIISFPTPTFLYNFSRRTTELLRLWKFHDERPLTLSEVSGIIKQQSNILKSKIIWPIFFTQMIIVARKK